MSNCKKCVRPVRDGAMRCWGPCKGTFHATCIDWKFENWTKLFKECPFAKFVCYDCQGVANEDVRCELDDVKHLTKQLAESLTSVKEMMEAKVEALADLIKQNQKNPDPPVDVDLTQTNAASASYSSQLARDGEIVGTGTMDNSILTVEVKKSKMLYVSHLNPSTTSEALQGYINRTFSIPLADMKTWSLIPKNRTKESLQFISFKVSLPEDVFENVLAPELWPKSCIVRPFINREPKNGGRMATASV